jgi:anti-sigma B factor antagonist
LGVLVAAHRSLADRGGALHVVCSKDRVLRLFDITGLREVLALHESLAAALAAAAGTAGASPG